MKHELEAIRKWSEENYNPPPELWAMSMIDRDAVFSSNAAAAESALVSLVQDRREDLAPELEAIPNVKYLALSGRIVPCESRVAQARYASQTNYAMTPLRKVLGY